jgi:hypothetical protein
MLVTSYMCMYTCVCVYIYIYNNNFKFFGKYWPNDGLMMAY